MEPMSKELCESTKKNCDERFGRDKERIESLEEMQKQFLTLQGQLTEILKNQTEQLKDHGGRLVELEKKPGQWLDRIISAALSAVIAFAVATFRK